MNWILIFKVSFFRRCFSHILLIQKNLAPDFSIRGTFSANGLNIFQLPKNVVPPLPQHVQSHIAGFVHQHLKGGKYDNSNQSHRKEESSVSNTNSVAVLQKENLRC